MRMPFGLAMAKLEAGKVNAGTARRLSAGSAPVAEVRQARVAARPSAQRELEDKLKAAFEQAKKDGLEQGQAQAAADFQKRLQSEQQALERVRQSVLDAEAGRRQEFAALLTGLQEQRDRMLREAEALAVELAFRAITRLLQARHEDRAMLAEVCSVAIQELGNSVIRVRVPQAASDLVRATIRPGIEVVVDASLQPGQCFIETPRGESEAGLATRLEGLKAALLAALNEMAGDA